MNLFSYYEGDSFLHRLNPGVKLVANLFSILVLTMVFDPITPLAFLLLALGTTWLLGRIPLLGLVRGLLPFLLLAFGFLWMNTVFPRQATGEVLFNLGPIMATREGLDVGLSLGFRVLCYVSYSLMFVMTTGPTQLVLSLIQQGRLSYRLGYGILAAYRFLPLLQTEFELIGAAHKIRGVGSGRGPLGALRRWRSYVIPLLASAIRKAERVAIAMDSKGFGASSHRTYYQEMKVSISDIAFLVCVVALILALLLLSWRLGSLRLWDGSLGF